MRSPEEVNREIVRQWLAKAEQDIKTGEALLAAEPPLLYLACFQPSKPPRNT